MRRLVFCCLLLLALPLAAEDRSTPPETAIAREQRLRATLTDPSLDATRRAAAEIELADLLVFTLERNFQEALDLIHPHRERARTRQLPAPEEIEKFDHLAGFALSYLGRNEQAEKILLGVRDSRAARLGPEAEATLEARSDLAIFYGRIGRPDLCEPELREVSRIYAERDADSDKALDVQTSWTITLGRLGRWAEAEKSFRDIIARRIRLLGPDDPRIAQQLGLLCWVLYSTGRSEEAVPLMERIVGMREKELGVESNSAFIARFNLASLYLRVRRYDEAEKLWRADLARAEAGPDEGLNEAAAYLRKLGDLALARNDPAKAITDLARGEMLYLKERANGWRDAESRDFESLRWSLARAYVAAGNLPAARRVTADWLTMLEEQFRRQLLFTSEVERLAFHTQEQPFDLPGTLGDPELLARATLRLKGLVLDSLLEDHSLARSAADPEIAELLKRYRAALTAETTENTTTRSPLELSERERLERELVQRTRSPASARAALIAEPAQVLAQLAPDTAFVDYVRYTHLSAGETTEPRYLALVGTSTSGWQVVPLGAAAPLEAALDRYRILTTRGGPLAWAREVRRLVLDPIRATLPAGITRLILSPDAQLHGVAFASLPEETGEALALDRHTFAQVTSARDLLPRHRASTLAPAGPPLAVAAPAWSGELARLSPLPEALAEGKEFAARSPHRVLLTGPAATPAALAAHLSPQQLHIATHAVTANDPALSPTDAMRRTGLALAGDQGWFDTLQIAALDLHATELVFLSACSTGVGATAPGEGVLGLQRGFARAGARAMIATLWPVADTDSRAFTRAFYDALEKSPAPAEALQTAQRTLVAQLTTAGVPPAERLRRAGAHVLSVRH